MGRNARACIYCRLSRKKCVDHPEKHHDRLKCQFCLEKDLPCGPYEIAQETVEFLNLYPRPPRSPRSTPSMFNNSQHDFYGYNMDNLQLPGLDPTVQYGNFQVPMGSQDNRAFTMPPGSQDSAGTTLLAGPAVASHVLQRPGPGGPAASPDVASQVAVAPNESNTAPDEDLGVLLPFVAYDTLRVLQKHIISTAEVLRSQGLEKFVSDDIEMAKEAVEKDMNRVLRQMVALCGQAREHGNVDRTRWMCLRLQRAMEDAQCLTDQERLYTMLEIHKFHNNCKDVSEADSIAQALLQLNCINSSSEKQATEVFTSSIETSLSRGSSETSQVDDIQPPLHRLAGLGKQALFSILNKAAASGIAPKSDFIGRTLLHVAAEKGDALLLEHLLNLGKSFPSFKLDIDGRDLARRTPLYLATSHGQESTYRLLRSWGASLEVRSGASHTLLAMAARANHIPIMEDLIEADCPIDERVLPALGGCPPLPAAAERGALEAVQLLIERGANREIRKMPDQKTAAQLARDNGHHGVAAIIESGG